MERSTSTDSNESSEVANTCPRPDIGDRSDLSDFEKLVFEDVDDMSDDLNAWSRYWNLFFHPELQSSLSTEELEKAKPKLERCALLYPQKQRDGCIIRFNPERYRGMLGNQSIRRFGTEPMPGHYCKVLVPPFPEGELLVGFFDDESSEAIVQLMQYFDEQTDEKQGYQVALREEDVEELEKWKESFQK